MKPEYPLGVPLRIIPRTFPYDSSASYVVEALKVRRVCHFWWHRKWTYVCRADTYEEAREIVAIMRREAYPHA